MVNIYQMAVTLHESNASDKFIKSYAENRIVYGGSALGAGAGGALAHAGMKRYNAARYRKLVKSKASKDKLKAEEERAKTREDIARNMGAGIGAGIGLYGANKLNGAIRSEMANNGG